MLSVGDVWFWIECDDSRWLSPQILHRDSAAWHLAILWLNSQHLLHWMSRGLSDQPWVLAITPKIETVLWFVRNV